MLSSSHLYTRSSRPPSRQVRDLRYTILGMQTFSIPIKKVKSFDLRHLLATHQVCYGLRPNEYKIVARDAQLLGFHNQAKQWLCPADKQRFARNLTSAEGQEEFWCDLGRGTETIAPFRGCSRLLQLETYHHLNL